MTNKEERKRIVKHTMKINLFSVRQNRLTNKIYLYIDFILVFLVIFYFISDILHILSSLMIYFHNCHNTLDVVSCMSEGTTNSVTTSSSTAAASVPSSTTTTIIHTDSGWSNTIRSIFIYGSGSIRYHLVRNGAPSTRAFVLASTIATDAVSKFITNAINDPESDTSKFFGSFMSPVKLDSSSQTTTVNISLPNNSYFVRQKLVGQITKPASGEGGSGSSTNISSSTSQTTSNLIPSIDDLNSFGEQLVFKIIEILKPVIQPVTVDYSNQLLANQVYVISIMLFVMCILITFLIVVFMMNLLLYSYSDKLISLFKNKYVIMYINFNKKIINIELWYLGIIILTFMYSLATGLHFLATHPIILS